MGTNVYWHGEKCPTCGRQTKLHIGLFSHGWPFIFRGYDGMIGNVAEWKKHLETGHIINEHGVSLTQTEFWERVNGFQKHTNQPHVTQRLIDPHDDIDKVDGYLFSFHEFS